MGSSAYVIAILVFSISFTGYAHGKDEKLTEFGKKAKSLISDEAYKKVFAVNLDNVSKEQLKEAAKESTEHFYKIIGTSVDEESLLKRVNKDDDKLGESNITPELQFATQTYGISKTLRELKILKDSNLEELAQKYADEVNEAAKSVKDGDFVSQALAYNTAVGKFLKSLKVTSKQSIKKYEQYYLERLEQSTKSKS